MVEDSKGGRNMTDLEYILEHLSRSEALAVLAEEAMEFAHAALKLRRTITEGAAPTPVTKGEAERAMWDECRDMLFAFQLQDMDSYNSQHGKDEGMEITGKLYPDLIERLANRIREKKDADCD
jgi:hypothetical protein